MHLYNYIIMHLYNICQSNSMIQDESVTELVQKAEKKRRFEEDFKSHRQTSSSAKSRSVQKHVSSGRRFKVCTEQSLGYLCYLWQSVNLFQIQGMAKIAETSFRLCFCEIGRRRPPLVS